MKQRNRALALAFALVGVAPTAHAAITYSRFFYIGAYGVRTQFVAEGFSDCFAQPSGPFYLPGPDPALGTVTSQQNDIYALGEWTARSTDDEVGWSVIEGHLVMTGWQLHLGPFDASYSDGTKYAEYVDLEQINDFGGTGAAGVTGTDLLHGHWQPGPGPTPAEPLYFSFGAQCSGAAELEVDLRVAWTKVFTFEPNAPITDPDVTSGDDGLFQTGSSPADLSLMNNITTPGLTFAKEGRSSLSGNGHSITLSGTAPAIDNIAGHNTIDAAISASSSLYIGVNTGTSLRFQQPLTLSTGTSITFGGNASQSSQQYGLVSVLPFTAAEVHIAGVRVSIQPSSTPLITDRLDIAKPTTAMVTAALYDAPKQGVLDITTSKAIIKKQKLLSTGAVDEPGSLQSVVDLVKQGRNGGLWNGPGVTSSVAARGALFGKVGVGVIGNNDGTGTALYTSWGEHRCSGRTFWLR